jgi:hypothetical protein
MAYNDQTVAINPDGDGNSVFYSDSNPTINGQYIGGGYIFGSDGSCSGHASAKIIYGIHHVASNNGYYIMNDERMFNTSDTFTTQQVINASGQWVGGNIYLQGDGYITRSSSSSKISIWAGGTYQGGQIDYYGGGGQTDCGTLIFRTGVGAGTTAQPERMRISNDGYVGIGTSSPNTPLHIVAGSGDGIPLLRMCATASPASFNWAGSIMSPYLCAGRNFVLLIGQEQSSKNSGYIGYNHTGTAGSNSNFLTFGHYASDNLMNLMADGKLGLGTTSPSYQFHVKGADGSLTKVEGPSGNYWYSGTDSSGTYIEGVGSCSVRRKLRIQASDGSGTYTQLFIDGGKCLIYTGNSKFGIGTSTPAQSLEISGNILVGANDVNTFTHSGGNIAHSADGDVMLVADSNGVTGLPSNDMIFGAGSCVDTDGNRSFSYNDAYPLGAPRCEWMRIKCNGNVGIGTNSPTKKLHVSGDFAIGTGTPLGNVGLMEITEDGSAKGLAFHNGGGTTFRVYRAGDIGILGRGDNINLSINCFGNIGINSCTPGSYKLYVNGAFYAAGSSCEYKTSICQYNTDSCMFMKLTPVTYQYKDEYTHLGKELKSGTQIGLIAEDVAEVYPELAILKDEDDMKIVRNVDYEKLSIVLLSEVQKLRKELDELKTK